MDVLFSLVWIVWGLFNIGMVIAILAGGDIKKHPLLPILFFVGAIVSQQYFFMAMWMIFFHDEIINGAKYMWQHGIGSVSPINFDNIRQIESPVDDDIVITEIEILKEKEKILM